MAHARARASKRIIINLINISDMEARQFTIPAFNLPAWTMAEGIGYEPQTTFWQDFCIAERISGLEGVQDTFKRAFAEWRDNRVYLAEMALVLNHRGWSWWHVSEKLKQSNVPGDNVKATLVSEIARYYFNRYYDVVDYVRDNYNEEDIAYFNRIID